MANGVFAMVHAVPSPPRQSTHPVAGHVTCAGSGAHALSSVMHIESAQAPQGSLKRPEPSPIQSIPPEVELLLDDDLPDDELLELEELPVGLLSTSTTHPAQSAVTLNTAATTH